MNKKIPYTAETFPMDAVWIRKKNGSNGMKRSITAVYISSITSTGYATSKDAGKWFNEIKFSDVDNWQIASTDGIWRQFYQEEKPWYEVIPKEGIWCWCWDSCSKKKEIDLIVRYNDVYILSDDMFYHHATPLTEEEKEKYLINYKV